MTARQDLVIAWRAMGCNYKQIAHLLGCSVKSVEQHLVAVRHKLGFNDAARLTHYALSHRLAELNQTTGA